MKSKLRPHTVVYVATRNSLTGNYAYEIRLALPNKESAFEFIDGEEAKKFREAIDGLVIFYAGQQLEKLKFKRTRNIKPPQLVSKKMHVNFTYVERFSIFESFEILLTLDDVFVRRFISILYPIITRLKDANNLNKSSCDLRGTPQVSECS